MIKTKTIEGNTQSKTNYIKITQDADGQWDCDFALNKLNYRSKQELVFILIQLASQLHERSVEQTGVLHKLINDKELDNDTESTVALLRKLWN